MSKDREICEALEACVKAGSAAEVVVMDDKFRRHFNPAKVKKMVEALETIIEECNATPETVAWPPGVEAIKKARAALEE